MYSIIPTGIKLSPELEEEKLALRPLWWKFADNSLNDFAGKNHTDLATARDAAVQHVLAQKLSSPVSFVP